MPKPPWVWETAVRRELIDEELDYLRTLGYDRFREMVGTRRKRAVTGRDGKSYRLIVAVQWEGAAHPARSPAPSVTGEPATAPVADALRVTVTVRGPRWHFSSLSDSFIIASESLTP